jgi:hypothetical protein
MNKTAMNKTAMSEDVRREAQVQALGEACLAAGLDEPAQVAAVCAQAVRFAEYLRAEARSLAVIAGESATLQLLDTFDSGQLETYINHAGVKSDRLFRNSRTQGATRVTQGRDPQTAVPEDPARPPGARVEAAIKRYNEKRSQRPNPLKDLG